MKLQDNKTKVKIMMGHSTGGEVLIYIDEGKTPLSRRYNSYLTRVPLKYQHLSINTTIVKRIPWNDMRINNYRIQR